MIIRQYSNRKLYVPTKGYITHRQLLFLATKLDDITVLNGSKDVTTKVLKEALKQLNFTPKELIDIIRTKKGESNE